MSHFMTALAMKQEGLKPITKIVLYWIADHHNGETGKCMPSHSRLSRLCEISRQSVINHISILEQRGLIRSEPRVRENGSDTSNSYTLMLSEGVNNIDPPCKKYGHTPVKIGYTLNLGNNNLGKEPEVICSGDFDNFWSKYPRKIGKGNARKAFLSASRKVSTEVIFLAVDAYAASVIGKEAKFIPHPATWLNQERWDDEIQNENSRPTTTDYLNSLFNGPSDVQKLENK